MSTPTDHLDLDALADHLAGVGSADAHLERCAGCRARLAELEAADAQVARALRGLAAPALPADLADRLSAALAAEPPLAAATGTTGAGNTETGATGAGAADPGTTETGATDTGATGAGTTTGATVTPLAPRRRGARIWVSSVAAAAVLVLGGVLGASLLGGSDVNERASVATDGAESTAGAAAPQLPGFATGADYADPAAATGALAQVLGDPARATAPLEDTTALSAPADAALDRLRDPVALEDCLAPLLDPARPDDRPLAIDYARYAGAPALAVVLPDVDPAKVAVYVVGPDCSRADDDLRFFTRLPRP